MFLLVSVRHVGAHPDELQHGVSTQSSINLGKIFPRISGIYIILRNWNKEPEEERIYRWTEFFHKLDNKKWKMRTGARATKQNYISIYISLYMKSFLKTGVYIYIYIYIYIYLSGFDKRYLQKFQVRFNNLTLEVGQ